MSNFPSSHTSSSIPSSIKRGAFDATRDPNSKLVTNPSNGSNRSGAPQVNSPSPSPSPSPSSGFNLEEIKSRFQRAAINFQWILDETSTTYSYNPTLPALRAVDRQGNVYTPITMLCMFETGLYYPSLHYHYAASEINIPQSIAYAIDSLSDNFPSPPFNNLSEGKIAAYDILKFIRYRRI